MSLQSIKDWLLEHKLAAVGGLWATGISTSLYLQQTGSAKASVKLIHSRMYAQALTLSALLAWAGVEYLDRDVTAAKAAVVDTASYAHQQKLKREASSS